MGHVNLVTVDSDGSSTATLATAAFTTSGSNRHIDVIVGISQTDANALVSCSRLSETYVQQRADANPSGSSQVQGKFIMSTTQPGTGSGALTCVLTTARANWGFAVEILDNVDQTTRIRGGTVTLNPDGDSTVADLSFSSATGDLVVSGIVVAAGTFPTGTDDDGTYRGDWASGTSAYGAVVTAPGATTVTIGFNGTPFRFVHYAASHPPATPPVNTVPVHTLGIYTTSDEPYVIADIGPETAVSVVDAAGLTTCRVHCTSGNLTVTLSGSVVVSAGENGTSDLTLGSGASTAEFNTVLATLTYQGDVDFHGTDTINVVSTGTGGTDTDTFNVLNDPRSLTLTASAANFASMILAVASIEMRMDAGRQSATALVTATDDADLTDAQTITLQVAPVETVFPFQNLAVPTARRDRR